MGSAAQVNPSHLGSLGTYRLLLCFLVLDEDAAAELPPAPPRLDLLPVWLELILAFVPWAVRPIAPPKNALVSL